MSRPIPKLSALRDPRNEYRVLALMLLVLHFSMWGDLGGPLSRSFMLAHLGLFLLWQPLWDNELRLKPSSALIFVLTALVLVVALDWWVMTFWLLLLIGIVGGRVTLGRTDRFAYLATITFLIAQLLFRCIPVLFEVEQASQQTLTLLGYGLLSLPIALALVPATGGSATTTRVDLLYGVLLSLIASMLASGGLLNTFHTGTPYVTALFQTVVGLAVFLLLISLLSSPRSGFSGLTQLWERYLLNIGTPFEEWLGEVADSAESRATPQEFLGSAMQRLAALPWVAGADWEAGGETSSVGQHSKHSFAVSVSGLSCRVYANLDVGTALLLHGKLLIHLIAHFYGAKQRELQLADSAHLHAIFETGARVTHDIKNLLQSLHTMSVAVDRSGDAAALELMQRQLPNLTQRLQLALDKLQTPGSVETAEGDLRQWWTNVKQRKQHDDIEFEEHIEGDAKVPVEMLDSTLENLLENARVKRQVEPGLSVEVKLSANANEFRLEVSDDGSPVDEPTRARLFKGPTESANGLGIGLFQAARQAEQLGYHLSLDDSNNDSVTFCLVKTGEPVVPPHPLRRRSDLTGPYAHLIDCPTVATKEESLPERERRRSKP